jgi:hypothetical protein
MEFGLRTIPNSIGGFLSLLGEIAREFFHCAHIPL